MEISRTPDYLQIIHNTPVGDLALLSDGQALVGVWLAGQKYFLENAGPILCDGQDLPVLLGAKNWLLAYFAGARPDPADLPLAPRGSAFRQLVWRLLLEIPHGHCASYGEIAQKAASARGLARMSPRAVGGAIGHNPLAIIIPCHRVVGHNGALTGYAGGLAAKRVLLELEGVKLQRGARSYEVCRA